MTNMSKTAVDNGAHELARLRKEWWIFLVVGFAMAIVGVLAIGAPIVTTIASVKLFGVFLLIGGIAQIVSSFWAGKWSGFLLHLMTGVLYAVVGFLFVDRPIENALMLTVLLAAFFIASGIIKIVVCLQERFCNWGWSLLSGVVTLLLGMIIWSRLPESSLGVIGLLIGIELFVNGWTWAMLGIAVRSAPEAEAE